MDTITSMTERIRKLSMKIIDEATPDHLYSPRLLRTIGKCYKKLALMVEHGASQDIEISPDLMRILRRAAKYNQVNNRVLKFLK